MGRASAASHHGAPVPPRALSAVSVASPAAPVVRFSAWRAISSRASQSGSAWVMSSGQSATTSAAQVVQRSTARSIKVPQVEFGKLQPADLADVRLAFAPAV